MEKKSMMSFPIDVHIYFTHGILNFCQRYYLYSVNYSNYFSFYLLFYTSYSDIFNKLIFFAAHDVILSNDFLYLVKVHQYQLRQVLK